MTAIECTDYPRLKSRFTLCEPEGTFTPTPAELAFAAQATRGDDDGLGLNPLVSLKRTRLTRQRAQDELDAIREQQRESAERRVTRWRDAA